MIWLSRLFVLAAAVLPPVSCHMPLYGREIAPSTVVDTGNLASKVPACAKSCFAAACPVGDSLCICHSDTLRAELSVCVRTSCNLTDTLRSQNLTDSSCGSPVRDRGQSFVVMDVALSCITAVFVGVRFLSRYLFGSHHGVTPDDWVALIIGAIGIPSIVLSTIGLAGHGLGRDVWTLSNEELTAFMRYFFILENLYVTLMMLVKLNLSLFYLDLFPGKLFRRMIWATILFQVSFYVAFLLVVLFQCTPSSYFWMRLSGRPQPHGRCIDMNAAGWANAVIHVAGDFWSIAIPVYSLHQLDLHWKKKIGAAIMFMTGFFVTIISIVRLRTLSHFVNSANPTWDQWDTVFWSVVEVNVGVICTCLPSIRLIVGHIFPRTMGSNFGLLPRGEKPSGPPPPPPPPDRRDEEEDIELCGGELGYPPAVVAKLFTEESENSTSIRTHGSVEDPERSLPVNLVKGLNIRGQAMF